MQSEAESSEEEVQILGIRKMKRKGGKARPSKRVRFEGRRGQREVKQVPTSNALVQTTEVGWAEQLSELEENYD